MARTNYATRDQYREMERLCKDLASIHLSDEEASKFVSYLWKTLQRKIKAAGKFCKPLYNFLPLNPPEIWFRGYSQSGLSKKGKIHLAHTPSLYLIIHEIAHETKGCIRMLVPRPKNTHGLPEHHGTEYMANLLYLRDLVRKQKGFKKYLESETEVLYANPKIAKQTPLVVLQESGSYSVKIIPNVQDQIMFYIFDNDSEEEWVWLENKIQVIKKNTIEISLHQLQLLGKELNWIEGYFINPEDSRILRKVERLSSAIKEAIKNDKRLTKEK